MAIRLAGIHAALATPFDRDGAVRPERLAEAARRLLATGLDGILVLGSTGEAVALDEVERAPLIAAARDGVPRGTPLIAGVDAWATRAAARQARVAAEAGADAVLVLTPHYFRDAMTAAALAAHFRAVADASPVPVLLYSVPKFTGVPVPPEAAVELSGHPNVAGIKHSDGDPAALLRIARDAADGFVVLNGHAPTVLETLLGGAHGAILAAASAVPEPFVALRRAVESGDRDAASTLAAAAASLAGAVAGAHGVAGVKAAMAYRGVAVGPPRPPLTPLEGAGRAAVEQAIDAAVAEGTLPSRDL